MAENQLSFDIKIGGNQDQALGSLKAQLKEATQEVQMLSEKFGATSEQAIEAAKRAAELKDQIGDAATLVDAFNPDTKFKAFSQTLGTVAGGFSAVQGALGLLGSKGEDVEKTLAKVQSALALSQGLEQLGDLGAAFTNLKGVAIDTFKGIKAAIGSTGIGFLVVALGAIVTYWDDIKEAVSGVSEEQKKLLTDSQANVKAEQEKLSAIDSQDNVLKLQGKSEKEILGLKIKQTDAVISATEKQVAQQKVVLQAQLAAEKRNKEILKGILTFVTAPLQLVIDGVNQVAKVFGKGFEFNVAEKLSGLVFDPKATEANGQKEIAVLDKTLSDLKNKKAGFQLAVQNIDRQGAKTSNADAERIRKEKEAAEKEAQLVLAEANKKLKTQQEQELLSITEAYAEKKKKLELAGIKDNGDLAAAEQKERQAVLDKYAKEEKDKKDKEDKDKKDAEIAFQKELNKITLETKLEGITDENAKAREQLLANFEQQRQDIDANEKYTAEQKTSLKLALAKKENQALAALKITEDKKLAADELSKLDKRIADNETDLQVEKSLLDAKEKLLKESYAKNLITEDEYKAALKANSKAKQEIDKQETAAKIENTMKVSALLGSLSDVIGKETAAGKAFAVAQATIDTYLGATKAYQSLAGIPVVGPALGAVAAGVAIAGGIKNVKSILSVQVPGGGGGGGGNISAPSLSTGAPIAPPQPQAQTTSLNTQTINALGNQATRAYVVESDVTNSQQRMAAIQQRARFG